MIHQSNESVPQRMQGPIFPCRVDLVQLTTGQGMIWASFPDKTFGPVHSYSKEHQNFLTAHGRAEDDARNYLSQSE